MKIRLMRPASTVFISLYLFIAATGASWRVPLHPAPSALCLTEWSGETLRTCRGGGGTNRPFPTWSFDEPCASMDWTSLPQTKLEVSCDSTDSEEKADLIIIGIAAPSSQGDDYDDDEEAEMNGEEEEQNSAAATVLTGRAKELDDELDGILSKTMVDNPKFKGGRASGSTTPAIRVFVRGGDGKAKLQRYVLLGLGKIQDISGNDDAKAKELGRKIGSAIATAIQAEKGITSCSVVIPANVFGSASPLSDVSSSFFQEMYVDNRYRTGDNVKRPAESVERVTVVLEEAKAGGSISPSDAAAAISTGKKLACGAYLTKDIVNSPHNVLNSLSLADTAKRIAEESEGRLNCQILEKDDCERLGMGAYLGVARGSETQPKLIHLSYRPIGGEIRRKVGIVGKGLLFDSGGYNIKTAMMELMKFDCGGAAAVLGAARSIAALAPEGVEAHFVVAACENMISERAVVPGDVLTAMNGLTIEVVNTDAEGRLTMADALVYVDRELGCSKIIELSTLTGACMVALGNRMSGMWTSDDGLAEELESLSRSTGEKTWRMPLENEYDEHLKSKIADLKNLGARHGGAIAAALFLQHFVNKKKPFAHVDIAGTVWAEKSGATGYGSRLVTEWVQRQGLDDGLSSEF